MLTLNEQEEMFDVKPIGIRYRCELCGKGEMIVVSDTPIPLSPDHTIRPMILHRCTNCKETMLLPKSYPYIEWKPIEESKEGVCNQ